MGWIALFPAPVANGVLGVSLTAIVQMAELAVLWMVAVHVLQDGQETAVNFLAR